MPRKDCISQCILVKKMANNFHATKGCDEWITWETLTPPLMGPSRVGVQHVESNHDRLDSTCETHGLTHPVKTHGPHSLKASWLHGRHGPERTVFNPKLRCQGGLSIETMLLSMEKLRPVEEEETRRRGVPRTPRCVRRWAPPTGLRLVGWTHPAGVSLAPTRGTRSESR